MTHTYRHSLKATAVMSLAQGVEAIISLIRAKIIAVLLGPVGIGINSILQITVNTIYQFTSMGVPQSAVRDISKAQNVSDSKNLYVVTGVFRRIMLCLAIISMALCIIGASMLSDISFGKGDNHYWDFIILSVGFFFYVLSYGNITIMQGTGHLSYLAKCSMLAAVFSLLLGIPFFLFLGNRGIAPAIALGFMITFFINALYVRKIGLRKTVIPWSVFMEYASPIIKLGIIIMISGVIINLFTYFTNVIIRMHGSLEEVGLYQAAFSLTNRNFAILSAAMTADYYPRLSRLLDNKQEFNTNVSEQGELLVLIVSAMSTFIIIFCPLLIRLLLSEEFLPICKIVRLISYSFVLRIIWLTMSYIPLAKGDKKTYLTYDALIGNGCYFVLNIFAYIFYGLEGLAYSCVIGTFFVSALFLLIYGKKYQFKYSRSFWYVQIVCISFVTLFMLSFLIKNITVYLVTSTILAISFVLYIYRTLESRVRFKQALLDYKRNFRKK